MMQNKLTITIYGNTYPITTQEDPAYVRELAKKMDKAAHELMDSGRISLNEALVLMALSYLDASQKADEGADHLRRQITEYADEAGKVRLELAEARKELERLKKGNG